MRGAAGPARAFAALALAGLCWGSGFPLGKVALRELAPAHMILLRFAVAAIVSLPFALASREARALFRSRAVAGAGVLYGLAFLVQFEGLARVTVTLAALLVGVMPALIAVTARAAGEAVSRTSWAGVAGATAGAVLIAARPGAGGSAAGVALSLASLLIFLAWLFALRRAPAAPAMAVPAVSVVAAAATVLPLTLALHGAPPLRLSPATWAALVGQGVLATVLATGAWAYGSARVGSAAAGVFINVEPLVGAILGVTLFDDPLGASLLAGGVLIVGGSLVVVLGERATPALVEAAVAGRGLPTE